MKTPVSIIAGFAPTYKPICINNCKILLGMANVWTPSSGAVMSTQLEAWTTKRNVAPVIVGESSRRLLFQIATAMALSVVSLSRATLLCYA